MNRLTPKQARTSLAALDNALHWLAVFAEPDVKPLYSVGDHGHTVAPTNWETEALFRLRAALILRMDDDK